MLQSDEDFLVYIENTLIPDLKESGREFTASDLERLVQMVKDRDDSLELMARIARKK